MADTQRNVEAAKTRLDSISLPYGGWTAEARAAALARLQSQGLPGRRDEYWRYTRPDTLTAATALLQCRNSMTKTVCLIIWTR